MPKYDELYLRKEPHLQMKVLKSIALRVKKTIDEDNKTYVYDKEGDRIEVRSCEAQD